MLEQALAEWVEFRCVLRRVGPTISLSRIRPVPAKWLGLLGLQRPAVAVGQAADAGLGVRVGEAELQHVPATVLAEARLGFYKPTT